MPNSIVLEIDEMGAKGEGVASWENQPVYVPFALPGETVRVHLDGQRARIEQVLETSPDRVMPPCKHFGACGGCQLQHWDRAKYSAWKRDLVVHALTRVGLETEIAPLVDAHGVGRRRATLHTDGHVAGYAGWRSNRIHPLDTCPILDPALAHASEIAKACGAIVGPCDVAFTVTDTGLDVQIRPKKNSRKQRTQTDRKFAEITQKFGIARLSSDREIIMQRSLPALHMGKATVVLPAGGFLQASQKAETVLSDLVLAGLGKSKRVADLFCGVGPFAVRIAERAQVFAIDNDDLAVAACDAALRGTSGLKVRGTEQRDLFADPLFEDELNKFDGVVFDPPRAGAKAQVEILAHSKVKKIVAVSCNPQTFARDAKMLCDGGYKLTLVTPVDQFLWSAHVELVAQFSH